MRGDERQCTPTFEKEQPQSKSNRERNVVFMYVCVCVCLSKSARRGRAGYAVVSVDSFVCDVAMFSIRDWRQGPRWKTLIKVKAMGEYEV